MQALIELMAANFEISLLIIAIGGGGIIGLIAHSIYGEL